MIERYSLLCFPFPCVSGEGLGLTKSSCPPPKKTGREMGAAVMDDDAELGGLGKWSWVAVLFVRFSLLPRSVHTAFLSREEGGDGNRIDGLGGWLFAWLVGWME